MTARDKRGADILPRATRPPASHCRCCGREAHGAAFCTACREAHGSKLPPRTADDQLGYCPIFAAESAAYAARLADVPAPVERRKPSQAALDVAASLGLC